MQHELLHLLGLGHFPYTGSLMSEIKTTYMTKIDLAVVAAIWDPRVTKSVSTTPEMCDALDIDDPAICSGQNLTEAEFLATALDDTEGWGIVEAFLCAKGDTCDIANATDIAADFL